MARCAAKRFGSDRDSIGAARDGMGSGIEEPERLCGSGRSEGGGVETGAEIAAAANGRCKGWLVPSFDPQPEDYAPPRELRHYG